MARAIGIDLGTTNSVASVLDGGTSRILMNPHNEELTPSVVCCEKFEDDEEGEICIGSAAANQARLFPADTIYSVKRIIGRRFLDESVQRMACDVSYRIVESSDPVSGLAAVIMGEQTYLPEEISAIVLREIKRSCENALGEEVTHAVVTVPAYFGEPARAATREAASKAGLVVKTLLPEPTAAALAYGIRADNTHGRFILVFDLGGGTFDISILSVVDQDYNVMEINGDHFLGGDDFDGKIMEMILDHVQNVYGADLSSNHSFRILAKQEAERAKRNLTVSESVKILVPEAAFVDGRPIHIRLSITRQQFEDAIGPLVQACMQLVKEALDRQSLTFDEIDDVLLVGGSTQVPLVDENIAAMFGKDKVRRNVNPMNCVAIGAAIMAERMKGIECPKCGQVCDESLPTCPGCGASLTLASSALEEMYITDIAANHFGIQTVEGTDPHRFKIFVEKGTEIPMREPHQATLYTSEENQNRIRVPVYEGRGNNVLQNERIGDVLFDLPKELPKGHPVHVAMQLDRSSIVVVTVKVEQYGWSTEERLVRDMMDEEPLFDEDDEDEEERMLASLEAYVERAHRFLADYGAILTDAQKNRLEAAVAAGQKHLDNFDGSAATQSVEELSQLLYRCGTASLLDQAYLAAHQADQQSAAEILELAGRVRQYAESGDQARLQTESSLLAAKIRQVYRERENVERIEAAQKYGGLLENRDTGNAR